MPPMTPSHDYAAAAAYLQRLKTRGVRPGLERMGRLLQALGNPHQAVPCIHIAGTNGKGSVAAMLESVLRAAGWRTGLYTSPHLVRLGERVQVDRRPLSEGEIAAYVREVQPIVRRLGEEHGMDGQPSYFEFMTAVAFLHFERSRCDIACIEVGLGGRHDATNVVTPEMSVITSIGLDHVDLLGATRSEIAMEKAGIVKPGRPVTIGRLPPDAEAVVRAVAASCGSPVFSTRETFGDESDRHPRTNLEGVHQRWNAAAATLVAEKLSPRWKLEPALVAGALVKVDWSGRWQRLAVGGRTVIIDSSHNEEGAAALDDQLARLVATTGRAPIIVAGVVGAVRARALVPVFCRHAREIHFVVPAQNRACEFDQLEALAASFSGRVFRKRVEELFPAAGVCAVGEEGDMVVVAGSIYLAGEVLARIDPARGASESSLQDF